MTALIDTHVLLWWFTDPDCLSAKTRDWIENSITSQEGRILLSPVSLWELENKRVRGKLALEIPVQRWLPQLVRLPGLQLIDTNAEIWITAAAMDWSHRDPADRIIAATAIVHQVPVVTIDRKFHAADSPVKAVW